MKLKRERQEVCVVLAAHPLGDHEVFSLPLPLFRKSAHLLRLVKRQVVDEGRKGSVVLLLRGRADRVDRKVLLEPAAPLDNLRDEVETFVSQGGMTEATGQKLTG